GVLGLLDFTSLAQRVVGQHDQEVHHRRDDDEVDGGGQCDVEVDELTSADIDFQDPDVGLSAGTDPVDQRLNDTFSEFGDQTGERGTDADRYRKVDDVAACEKCIETLQHRYVLSAVGMPQSNSGLRKS